MVLSLEALPTVMESQRHELKAYTDSAVSSLETRLQERLQGVEQRLMSLVEQKQRAQDDDLRAISLKLEGMSADIGAVKSGFTGWEVQLEHVAGISQGLREIQAAQTSQAEAIQTLQSDVYGTPARGRKTIFGLLEDLTGAVTLLTDQARESRQWIAAETVRQAETRERWLNRQQAALGLIQMIPVKAVAMAALGGSATLLVLLKMLGG
jgi:hypothetical protein